MRTPSEIGAAAELEVAAALHRAGMTVYVPMFAPRSRVDLVIAAESCLRRVQCKTSRLIGDVLTFRTCSNTANRPVDYRGQVDLFGVWSPELGKAYLVPVGSGGIRLCSLRVGPTRNNQVVGVLFAADYEVRPAIPRR